MLYATTIGIDVHAKANSVCAINYKTGEITETTLDANPKALIAWISKNNFEAPLMCVYESGPTGFGLARALAKEDIPCQIAAVSKLPRSTERRKTDKIDARTLARLHMAGEVHAIWIPTPEEEALKSLSRLRGESSLDLRRAKQRVTSFLLLNGIFYDKGKRWTQKFMRWAAELEFPEAANTYIFREKLAQVIHLTQKLANVEKHIEEAIQASPILVARANRIRCLSGVGDVIAWSIVAELGDLARFRNGAVFASFLGLVPSESSSGEREHRGRITKCGNSHLRKLLVEGASTYSRKLQPRLSETLR